MDERSASSPIDRDRVAWDEDETTPDASPRTLGTVPTRPVRSGCTAREPGLSRTVDRGGAGWDARRSASSTARTDSKADTGAAHDDRSGKRSRPAPSRSRPHEASRRGRGPASGPAARRSTPSAIAQASIVGRTVRIHPQDGAFRHVTTRGRRRRRPERQREPDEHRQGDIAGRLRFVGPGRGTSRSLPFVEVLLVGEGSIRSYDRPGGLSIGVKPATCARAGATRRGPRT